MGKLTIPEIREEMIELSAEADAAAKRIRAIAKRIGILAEETKRRAYDRAPVTSRRITDDVKRSVRIYAQDHPDASQQEIAEAHNINMGRVSEILHGKRG